MVILEIQGLTKTFNGRKAADRLNLAVQEGEIFGLLGPNGAGKSTVLAMLSTILPPTQGTAIVGGHDILQEPKEVRRIIGVVPQDIGLYNSLTAKENLTYFGRLYGLEGNKLQERIRELLTLVQLKNRANDLVKTFSGGMRHRLNLAVGLIHKPRLLFLDEPTAGLDPAARSEVWEYIKKFQNEGVSILLTTHYMEEADYLCNRVAIMNRGKIIALGTPAKLKRSIGKLEVVEMKVAGASSVLLTELSKIRGVKRIARTTNGFRLLTPNADVVIGQIIKQMKSTKAHIKSLNIIRPTLEDVFLKLTGKTLGD